MGLFLFFCSLHTLILMKNCRRQRDSNSDRQRIRRARWPHDHHHHGPIYSLGLSLSPYYFFVSVSLHLHSFHSWISGYSICNRRLWLFFEKNSWRLNWKLNKTCSKSVPSMEHKHKTLRGSTYYYKLEPNIKIFWQSMTKFQFF